MFHLSSLVPAFVGLTLATPAEAQTVGAWPADAEFSEIVLGAYGQLRISDRVVVDGDVASSGFFPTIIGNDNEISGDVISIPDVRIGDRTWVSGSVSSAGTVDVARTTETGSIITNTGAVSYGGGGVGDPGPSSGDLVLPPDSAATLTEQRHDRITVFSRSELVVTAGIWYVDYLTIEPEASIVLDTSNGPITLVVRHGMTARGAWVPHNDGASVALSYLGQAPLLLETSFVGEVDGHGATLILGGNNTEFVGSFFSERIEVRPGVRVLPRRPEQEVTSPICQTCTRPTIIYGD